MKKILLLCTLICLLICWTLVGCSAEMLDQADIEASANWMRDITDSAYLSELSIPGTHDSGAYRTGLIANMAQDQTYDIATQLDMGVRFLDIRLVLKKGVLGVYHGVVNEKLRFDKVTETCYSFLADHPDECILMCIKRESGDNIAEAVHEAVDRQPDRWYTENAIPKLGDVRGKIVLFRRFEDEQPIGVDLESGFQDNCTFDIEGPVRCHVQDCYKLDKDALSDKWETILDTFTYAHASAADEYVINFTSAYYDKPVFSFPAIKETAKYVHEQIDEFFPESLDTSASYGIVLFDFVNPQYAQYIYSANDNYTR